MSTTTIPAGSSFTCPKCGSTLVAFRDTFLEPRCPICNGSRGDVIAAPPGYEWRSDSELPRGERIGVRDAAEAQRVQDGGPRDGRIAVGSFDPNCAPIFLTDLIRLADHCVALYPLQWKRLRIAISPEEEAQLRDYVHNDRSEAFCSAIRGIPVVVEQHPSDPLFRYEPVPDRRVASVKLEGHRVDCDSASGAELLWAMKTLVRTHIANAASDLDNQIMMGAYPAAHEHEDYQRAWEIVRRHAIARHGDAPAVHTIRYDPVEPVVLKPLPCDMKVTETIVHSTHGATIRDLLGAKPVPEPPQRELPTFPPRAMKE